MQCPRCQHANRPDHKFCSECGTALQRAAGNVQPTPSYADLQHSLTEALEQQSAMAEILRIISTSATNLQPVLDEVVKSAARFCAAPDASLFRLDGGNLRAEAHHGAVSQPTGFLVPLVRGTVAGRSVLERQTIAVTDLQVETDEYPEGSALARQTGQRATLSAPLLREGTPIGVILLRRGDAVSFTGTQIALLKTFANQAVIAIENVRLFTELQERNRALTEAHAQVTEALEQQTATSEILRVISSSPTDLQPVFNTIVQSGLQLLGGYSAVMLLVQDDQFHLAAYTSTGTQGDDSVTRLFPIPMQEQLQLRRAVLEKRPVVVEDAETEPGFTEAMREMIRARGWRSSLQMPMMRDNDVIGLLNITRQDPGPFASDEIALLGTFGAQAVIAIENVRLFKELQTSNRDLTTALDKQTATSDILRVISRSQTDIRPVFDTIIASAVRLLGGHTCGLTRVTGDQLELVALTSIDAAADAPVRTAFPQSLQAVGAHPQAIRDRVPLNVADAHADARLAEGERVFAGIRGFRSWVVVPMLRNDVTIGSIGVTRREAGGFTADEIALLQTFADQAVIAIENVRLFKELQERNRDLTVALDQQTATSEILSVISRSQTDVQPVFDAIVQSGLRLCDGYLCVLTRFDGGRLHLVALNAHPDFTSEGVAAFRRPFPVTTDEAGLLGRAIVDRIPYNTADIVNDPRAGPYGSSMARALGYRALVHMPMLREETAVGAISVGKRQGEPFSDKQIALLRTFADQAVIAIENVRLFKELEAANRELAAASQHKSEFLANMSHELRTPLNAIIGFSEVLSEKMFGDLNEKQEEYQKDIHASGQHLLSLINDILDLSKIEAGRMELELTDFDLPTALDNALTLVRERAGRRNITLQMSVDERLGEVRADERKIRQVVLNLLSNAIKFTPEGGRIEVGAMPKDGFAEVSVSDTGVGIAPEDQEAVFEEFRQVGKRRRRLRAQD